jgi:hypothetical protein
MESFKNKTALKTYLLHYSPKGVKNEMGGNNVQPFTTCSHSNQASYRKAGIVVAYWRSGKKEILKYF